jgi:thiomorpholine-carboxylate dehydrogenase
MNATKPAQQLSPSVPFFDEAAVRSVLRFEELIPAMERALIDFSAGRVTQPVRSIVPVPEHEGFMGLMPAVYGEVMGTKLVNFYPENGQYGVPTHLALIAVFRSKTGEPLAVMDGRLITEMRTAAVSAAAAKKLATAEANVLAILGSGVQARSHFEALSLVRRFQEVRVWSRSPEHARLCASEIGAKAVEIEEALRGADVVVTATSSAEPLFRGQWVKPGALVLAVGAVGTSRRELDDATMHNSCVLVDSREAAKHESGDVVLSGATVYAELGEVLAGTRQVQPGRNVVFKSLGIAVEDIASARLVLRKLQVMS